jgi:hypothetical protein
MSEQCKERVWRDWSSSNCARKAVKDGYCKQHHPDAVKERQEKASARWNEKVNNSDSAKLKRALDTIEQLTRERDELEQDKAELVEALEGLRIERTTYGGDSKAGATAFITAIDVLAKHSGEEK